MCVRWTGCPRPRHGPLFLGRDVSVAWQRLEPEGDQVKGETLAKPLTFQAPSEGSWRECTIPAWPNRKRSLGGRARPTWGRFLRQVSPSVALPAFPLTSLVFFFYTRVPRLNADDPHISFHVGDSVVRTASRLGIPVFLCPANEYHPAVALVLGLAPAVAMYAIYRTLLKLSRKDEARR